jgi:hypothetical protein
MPCGLVILFRLFWIPVCTFKSSFGDCVRLPMAGQIPSIQRLFALSGRLEMHIKRSWNVIDAYLLPRTPRFRNSKKTYLLFVRAHPRMLRYLAIFTKRCLPNVFTHSNSRRHPACHPASSATRVHLAHRRTIPKGLAVRFGDDVRTRKHLSTRLGC